MIDKTSRYAKVEKSSTVDASGQPVEALALRPIPVTTGVYNHTCLDGERLDHLAHRYFRDPTKFWRICDASEVLDPFDVIVPGRAVLIPPDK